MGIQNSLYRVLDRKQWEMCSPAPTASVAGSMIVSSTLHDNYQLYMTTVSACYLYDPAEDAWITLPASGLAGTFGAGTCGVYHPFGPTGTASAGSSTTLTTTLTIPGSLDGYTIRLTGGTGAGQERIIASNTYGANSVITVSNSWTVNPDATTTYVLITGRFWIFVGNNATQGLRYYDVATNTWSGALSVTGIPATFATDAKIRSTPGTKYLVSSIATSASSTTLVDSEADWVINRWNNYMLRITEGTGAGQARVISSNTATTITVSTAWSINPDSTSKYVIEGFVCGIATSATSTTLVNAAKSWATNQWANYQVRIVQGTGAGQVRTIASNNGTTLTVSAWSVTPDSTSLYVIEGNDDFLYLAGNANVAMYRYSISGNTWSTLAPGVARAGAPGAGMSLNWINSESDSSWNNESSYLNGRRLYSFRGVATADLHYYDIPSNTWVTVTYLRSTETFTTGTSWDNGGDGTLYSQKDATSRFFKFDVHKNELVPFSTLPYPQSTAIVGDRLFTVDFQKGPNKLTFLYHLRNTGTELFRCLVF